MAESLYLRHPINNAAPDYVDGAYVVGTVGALIC